MTQAASARRCFQPPDKLAGELLTARRQAEILKRVADVAARRIKVVEPGDEIEVLLDRQVLVEGKALRHVADFAANAAAVAAHVETEHGALALVGRQQAAHHADGRRLAGAVGTEKAGDLAFGNLHRDVIDHGAAGVTLDHAANIDDVH
jgi:hypothetical protein